MYFEHWKCYKKGGDKYNIPCTGQNGYRSGKTSVIYLPGRKIALGENVGRGAGGTGSGWIIC